MGTAAELASLIRERGPALVLTGAGMSTESGIPDFRSASGIWAEVDPFEVASIEAFRRDPLRVWRWYGSRIHGLLAAEPNAGHVALAALEHAGHVRAVVTQNIDLLHTRAGSGDVIEVHGSIARFTCLACGGEETLETVLAQLEMREAPLCSRCGTIVKPGVVMFGELLPAHAMERAEVLGLDDRGVGEPLLERRQDLDPLDRVDAEVGVEPHHRLEHRRRISRLLRHDRHEDRLNANGVGRRCRSRMVDGHRLDHGRRDARAAARDDGGREAQGHHRARHRAASCPGSCSSS